MKDETIIRGIGDGDSDAINIAINKYSKLMWSISARVLSSVGSPEDIEECAADVFVYLWQNHNKYKESRGSLKSWLSVVAKSKAIDRYRLLSKTTSIPLNEEILIEAIGVIDEILSAESKRELLAVVNALAEPDREIIIRRFYYEQKPKDIAFALDIPVKQVENHIYRSKAKLRSAIAFENGGFRHG